MEAFELDSRCKPMIFWLLVDMLDGGELELSQIVKPLYASEYLRYKGVSV